ncbi:hypothetical protein COO72_02430 [Bifidobacterium callitrichos]|nr:hypothetical protein COO72_02430 [Bifidobacterium callitrichos]
MPMILANAIARTINHMPVTTTGHTPTPAPTTIQPAPVCVPFGSLNHQLPPLSDTKTVAQATGIPEGTLAYWRSMGLGPAFVKAGHTILYPDTLVIDYLERNTRKSTVRNEDDDTEPTTVKDPFTRLMTRLPIAGTAKTLADITGVPEGTLAYWRSMGLGPAFVKAGHTILYPRAAVIAFLRSRLYTDNNATPYDKTDTTDDPMRDIQETLPAITTPKTLAQTLGIPEGTLAYWRCMGIGPAFVKAGRKVLYSKDTIANYMGTHLYASTVQADQEAERVTPIDE